MWRGRTGLVVDDGADLGQIGLVSWGWVASNENLLKPFKASLPSPVTERKGVVGAVFSSFRPHLRNDGTGFPLTLD